MTKLNHKRFCHNRETIKTREPLLDIAKSSHQNFGLLFIHLGPLSMESNTS